MEQLYVNAENTDGPKTISDVLLERLMAWGVDTIFGMPGDGINGFVEALRKKQKQLRYIHVRHEEIGALAAVAYAPNNLKSTVGGTPVSITEETNYPFQMNVR